jgi:hypothetical protein
VPPLELDLGGGDPLSDDDLQLALYCCYELHYRGFAGVDPDLEWEPGLIATRNRLEASFIGALPDLPPDLAGQPDAAAAVWQMIESFDGPSLSSFAAAEASFDQLAELMIHRSAYQLKEADPHTWGIPRLAGRAKAAMVEIQSDEYGGGVESEMHSTLFADTLRSMGLDDSYGAYLDLIPAATLATVNLVSMLGLRRSLRGELVGHLALFEMTSVTPMTRYRSALERVGVPAAGRRFFEVHVEVDAHHEVVATRDLIGGLVEAEPDMAPAVVRGAWWLMELEDRFARHVLSRWQAGRSSLLPVPGCSAAAAG